MYSSLVLDNNGLWSNGLLGRVHFIYVKLHMMFAIKGQSEASFSVITNKGKVASLRTSDSQSHPRSYLIALG